ncbi:MAG TPA: di-heme oxidoredictase family protein [Vicinamibacterales bacterium]|nr:di-heme oxidoredictase family protein [Vicinamibacterales bacterium]
MHRALINGLLTGLAACAAAVMLAARSDGTAAAAPRGDTRGARIFTRVWTAGDGLGPFANAQSCAACHSTPHTGGSGGSEANAMVLVSSEEQDDTGGHLFRQLWIRPGHAVVKRPLPRRVFRRRAPSLFGVGPLERVSVREIAARADPSDADADGISGRLPVGEGRFGWKSRFQSLEQAVAAALINELGVSNAIFHGPRSGAAEISGDDLRDLVEFVRGLPAPKAAAVARSDTGATVFRTAGCAACHDPRASGGTARAAYTDLLLHDMGAQFAEAFPDGDATGAEFRTAPLWGIAASGPPYLHDGRAANLHEAILGHGGEATASRRRYERLPATERRALLLFLKSL